MLHNDQFINITSQTVDFQEWTEKIHILNNINGRFTLVSIKTHNTNVPFNKYKNVRNIEIRILNHIHVVAKFHLQFLDVYRRASATNKVCKVSISKLQSHIYTFKEL